MTLSRVGRPTIFCSLLVALACSGFGAANSVMIQGDGGVIIVDTQYGTEAAEQVRDAFRQITQDPVVGVIYTHGHSDHTGGTSVFTEGAEVPIFAGPPSAGTLDRYGTLSEALAQRGRRQFGSNLQLSSNARHYYLASAEELEAAAR